MTWGAVGAAAIGVGGSYLAGKSAESAADKQADAMTAAANSARFKPVGMTTRFGTSEFEYINKKPLPTRKPGETDEEYANKVRFHELRNKSRLAGAGYEVSPELANIQDYLMGLTGGALEDVGAARAAAAPLGEAARSLFGLGSQYLATTPAEARQQYLDEQYAMLDPIRQREEQRLSSGVFGRGRAGLNIGDMGQPELFALASARRAQDAQLAAQAEQAAQQRATFGTGLFSTGGSLLSQQYGLPGQSLNALQSYLGTTGSIEEMAQQPLQLSLQVAGMQQGGNSAAANLLSQAAATRAQGSMVGPSLLASNIANFGNQYLANQRQQGMFDNMMRMRLGAGSGGFGGTTYSPSMYDYGMGVNFTAPGVYGG